MLDKAVWRGMTKDEARDTGMAMVLLALIVFAYTRRESALIAAFVLHLLNMTVPQVFRPVAIVWLGLSRILGAVVSKIVLSVIFLVVVSPLALLRRAMGKDSLKLRMFKASDESVMLERNHLFVGKDIEQPY